MIYLDVFLRCPTPIGRTWGQLGVVVVIVGDCNQHDQHAGVLVQNVATVAKVGFLSLLIALPTLMGKSMLVIFRRCGCLRPSPPQISSDVPAVASGSSTQRCLRLGLR